MVLPSDDLQAIPAAFLADLGALRGATAEVANQNLLRLRMNMGYFSWASVDAFAATYAFLCVNCDSARVLVYAKSLEWASFNAWVIFALSAEMRKLYSWNQHENSDS